MREHSWLAPMAEYMPSGLLEACVVVGVSNDKLKEVYLAQQLGNGTQLPVLDTEVLQVHAPPFVTKENAAKPQELGSFSWVQRRRSFVKKRERSAVASGDRPKAAEGPTEDVSVPKDIDLVALPQLCFPGGLQVTNELKDDCFHFLVFTDVFGNQTHGVVVQHYRPFQLFHEGSSHQNGRWSSFKTTRLYTAYGICVISKHPYYNALRDCLSCLLGELKISRMTDFEERVKEFSAKLTLVPIPPPGQLHVMFNLRPLMIVLPSREDRDHPVVDLDLHLPFLCFRTKQLLQILTGILMEQRMVFFSSDWARLTLMAECFMRYIHPLRWQNPLVPILSHQMLDFVMAPTPFLMGCHLSHYKEVAEETDDLILINIDDGTVFSSCSEHVDIPDVPSAPAECFKKRRKRLQVHYDLEVIHLATSTDINDLRTQRRRWQQNLNREIQKVTLELIVNIFRDVNDHLNYEHRMFNKDEFIKTRELEDQPFYKKVLESHIVHSFLKDRLSRKMDAFTRMEVHTRSEAQKMKAMIDNPRRPTIQEMAQKYSIPGKGRNNQLGTSLPNLEEGGHLRLLRETSLTKVIPETPLRIPPQAFMTFTLPEFHPPLAYHYVQNYYAELILLLGRAMAAVPPESSALLARYYYLRGFTNTLCAKRLDALSDFQNLYRTDVEIFPRELVKTLVGSLQRGELEQAERRPELKRLIARATSDEEKDPAKSDDHVKRFQLPKSHMLLEDFVKRTQESGIVKDAATIRRLFEALTVGQQKQIEPEVFRVFYTFWKETEAEAQDVHLPVEVIEHLDNNECVYKLSSSVKTNHGVGKIAMTQKRLFLLTEGRPGYVEIAKFRDIEEVKISSTLFLLLRIPSLRIKSSLRKEIFEANLKTECDLWNLMVKEMWAGRKMADDHKDPQYMQQALTNVLLMDAVVGCLQTQKAVFAASKLAYYDKVKQEGPMMVPKTTSETLKHKINPSLDLTSPQTVDVLLYTPGQLNLSDSDGGGNPKLWCALSLGKVVVFDAASWSMQQNCIQVGDLQLNCMLGLDQEQVWIGSQDSTIYIINTRSMSCHKHLTEHRDEVTDFAVEEGRNTFSQTQVYSCSADGTVIVWDIFTLKVQKQFQLTCDRLESIQLYSGTLWCCARDCIMELRKNGTLHRRISLPDDLRSASTVFSSFILLLERGQIWTSCADSGELCVWQSKDLTKPCERIQLPDSVGVTCMIKVKGQIWVGCRGLSSRQGRARGKIFVVDTEKNAVEKELMAHTDSVQALCSAEDRYVLSGSACQDGKIAIWKVE